MNPTPRIILIDDNNAWLESLAEYLRDHGVEVFTASDPVSGLELLDRHSINLVISDFNLPYMDGLQVLRNVRLHGGNVSVVLLTSEEEPELEKKVLAEGAYAFFCKTTEPALLLRRLLQAVAALAAAPRGLEIWQRLLPGPKASALHQETISQIQEVLDPWQRLLPGPGPCCGSKPSACNRQQPAA
jgi:two-component system, chemotaxis family, chemotaxis protein CheY